MVVLSERPDGIRIIRVESLEEGLQYRTSFAGAYQDIFSEPPYEERFRPSEAMGVLRNCLETPEQITLLAVKGRSRVVGFNWRSSQIDDRYTSRTDGIASSSADLGICRNWVF